MNVRERVFGPFKANSPTLCSTTLMGSNPSFTTVLPAKWVRADDESIDVLESRRVKGLNSRTSWIFPKVLLPRVRWYLRARGEWKLFIAKTTVAIQSEILAKLIAHCYELLPLCSWTKDTSRVNTSYTKIKRYSLISYRQLTVSPVTNIYFILISFFNRF